MKPYIMRVKNECKRASLWSMVKQKYPFPLALVNHDGQLFIKLDENQHSFPYFVRSCFKNIQFVRAQQKYTGLLLVCLNMFNIVVYYLVIVDKNTLNSVHLLNSPWIERDHVYGLSLMVYNFITPRRREAGFVIQSSSRTS